MIDEKWLDNIFWPLTSNELEDDDVWMDKRAGEIKELAQLARLGLQNYKLTDTLNEVKKTLAKLTLCCTCNAGTFPICAAVEAKDALKKIEGILK